MIKLGFLEESMFKEIGCNLSINFVIHGVMVVFQGLYAFKNPEKTVKCYVSDFLGEEEPYHSTMFLGDDYTDVSNRYHIVLICGFVLSLINLLQVAFGFYIYKNTHEKIFYYETGKKKFNKIMLCSMMTIAILTLAFLIFAGCVIFSNSGQLCRKDPSFLPKSGQFIYVWVILLYCITGVKAFFVYCWYSCWSLWDEEE